MNQVKKVIYKVNTVGIAKTAKQCMDEMARPFVPTVHKKRWNRLSRKSGFSGVSNEKREQELIVSLTTYPARIQYIHTVIESLMMQTTKPNKIILWLANEQFPEREVGLPEDLLSLKRYGLTIDWCNDIRSYKKLIPTIKKYPDAVIITADDDMYYHPKMVQRLYDEFLKKPNYIHCHRVTKFYMHNGKFETTAGGYDIYKHPSYLHKLTGGSGSCYPPQSLPPDMTDESLFMRLAPTNDDIWFWLMGVLAGLRCNVVKHSYPALYFVEGSQTEALNYVNDRGEKLFWKQFKNILDYYPQLEDILKNEWKMEIKKRIDFGGNHDESVE